MLKRSIFISVLYIFLFSVFYIFCNIFFIYFWFSCLSLLIFMPYIFLMFDMVPTNIRERYIFWHKYSFTQKQITRISDAKEYISEKKTERKFKPFIYISWGKYEFCNPFWALWVKCNPISHRSLRDPLAYVLGTLQGAKRVCEGW
jgi:hypothetical protein